MDDETIIFTLMAIGWTLFILLYINPIIKYKITSQNKLFGLLILDMLILFILLIYGLFWIVME